MYSLQYEKSTGQIYIKDDRGRVLCLEKSFSSVPQVSPDGKKAIYISPLEWEEDSELILFDLEQGKRTKFELPIKEGDKAKDVIWLDNKEVAIIIGFRDGTVSIGGNIYRYDFEYESLREMTHFDSLRKQVIKLVNVSNDVLFYDAIEFIDTNSVEFVRKREEYSLIKSV